MVLKPIATADEKGFVELGAGDLFGFQINYNDPQMATALYNGNISETYWKTATDNLVRNYGYAYDQLNRLTHAHFTKPEDSNEDGAYNEYLTYDKNGNILSLFRTGKIQMDTNPIDILSYKYNGNQLQEVDDESNSPQGFLDGNIGSLDYEYDLNGNLKKDNNKGITNITYNHLNLPKEIIFNTGNLIRYTYNAMGQKLEKVVKTGAEFAVTDYMSGFQYRSSYTEAGGNQEEPRLQYFPTAEGYVEWLHNHPRYVYNYTDHLGNIRLSYAYDENVNMLRIIEENNYYPFGLKHQNYNNTRLKFEVIDDEVILHQVPFSVGDGKYNYKYNGKEYQEELGLNWSDYGARNYDAALGRWMNVDPLAETSRRYSPYTYALDNPVFFIDPDGMQADWHRDAYDNIVADAGDSPETLATYLNVSVAEAEAMFIAGGYAADDKLLGGEYLYDGSNNLNEIVVTGKSADVVQNSLNDVEDTGGDIDYYSDLSRFNTLFGFGMVASEQIPGTLRINTSTKIISPKFYFNGWWGNQYARTFSTAKVAKGAGIGSTIFGIGLDWYGVSVYNKNPKSPNAVTPVDASINTSVAGYASFTGPGGIIIGVIYSATDAFYPDGKWGAMRDYQTTIRDFKASTGENYLYPMMAPF